MGFNSEFDKKIEDIKRVVPEKLHEAFVFVNDTLDICRQSAKEIFGENVKPEYAFRIYDRIVKRSGIKTKADFESALEGDYCEDDGECEGGK